MLRIERLSISSQPPVKSSREGGNGMANYDAIIIGTGQAGPSLARRLAGSGMKVAITAEAMNRRA